jgi:hypothetical protein
LDEDGLMPYPWTPRDIAVKNHLLPVYQLIAQNQRRVAMAQNQAMSGQPMAAPTAAAPTAGQPISLFPERLPQPVRPPVEIIRRQASSAQPAPVASGQREPGTAAYPGRLGMLAGMASGLSNVLARRPNAGIGEMLLGIGGGGLAGQAEDERYAQLEDREARRDRLVEAQIAGAEAKAQAEIAQRQQIQAMLNDPSVPPSQKRILQMSMAGVPAAGIEAVAGPRPMSEYERASLGQRASYQGAMVDIARARAGRERIPTPFGSGEAGYYVMGPDGKPQQVVAPVAKATAADEPWKRYENVGGKLYDPATNQVVYDPEQGEGPRKAWLDIYQSERRSYAPDAKARATADQLTQQMFGGSAWKPTQSPIVATEEEAPGGGLMDYLADYLPWGSEETPTTATAGPSAAPAVSGVGGIESMGFEELEALDPYSLTQEERDRAAARWDALNAGQIGGGA